MSILHIQVTNLPEEDILSIVNKSIHFINNSLKLGGRVLVHCLRGKSRSASIIVAFIMQKYKISLEKALERVRAIRSCIDPHKSFLYQLKLYESMRYKLDSNNMQYRLYKLYLGSHLMKKARILYLDNLESIIDQELDDSLSKKNLIFIKCKKCRRTLASSKNLVI